MFYGLHFTKKKKASWFYFSKVEFLTVLSKYWKYPTILALGTFAQFFVFELPIFMMSKNYTKELLGHYVMANKLVVQSFWLLTGSLAMVFQNKFVDEKHNGGINVAAYRKFLILAFLGSLPIVILLKIFGQQLFVFFLGSHWDVSGQFVTFLAPLVITKLLIGPAISYFLSHEKVIFMSAFRTVQLVCLSVYFYISNGISIFELIKYYVYIDFFFDALLIGISYYKIKKQSDLSLLQNS
jgi:O-antigen/teichoic acid export membrane protein